MMKNLVSKMNLISNPKGKIIKFLDTSSKDYKGFGEVYFSFINKNNIKAWKINKKATSNLIVPIGKVLIVVYDLNENLVLKRVISSSYKVLIPKSYIYGFMGIGDNNLIVNFLNKKHSKNNAIKIKLSKFNFNWKKYKK